MITYEKDDLESSWEGHMRAAATAFDCVPAGITGYQEKAAVFHLSMAQEVRARAAAERRSAQALERRWHVHAPWWVIAAFLAIWYACHGCAADIQRPAGAREKTAQAAAAVSIYRECAKIPAGGMFGTGAILFKAGYGSGVVMGPREVLTAAHVASCPEGFRHTALTVTTASGRVVSGQLERADASRDIAVVRLWEDVPAAPLALGPASPGQDVCYEAAWPQRVRHCGKVSKIRDQRVEQGADVDVWLQWSKPEDAVVGGNSGSGVYDMSGRLVGLATNGGYDELSSFAVAVAGRIP
jgi:hypothetical protein